MDERGGDPRIDADDLAEGLRAGQLTIAYQPKVEVASGRIQGVEALARWNHPRHGAIPPTLFVALAEAGELIHPFTEWVISTVTADWAEWCRNGLRSSIAVNVSARNLSRIDFPDMVAACCRKHRMPHRELIIELTESATGELIDLLDTLSRFRIKQFGVSLDDFGTGHSSLERLERLPFSEVKIDRSFVTDIDRHEDRLHAVRDIIDMVHGLGLEVVAEGVETEAVRAALARLGCDLAQGYYFARPMPADALLRWASASR